MRGPARALALFLFSFALMAQRPWQQITVPSAGEAASNFNTPPREYGTICWAMWRGDLTQARIVSELDQCQANGVFVASFGPSRGMPPKYFSAEHLALVKFGIEQASQRGMKVWLASLSVGARVLRRSAGPVISGLPPAVRLVAIKETSERAFPAGTWQHAV
jgi:hypothetical protein